MGSKQIFHKNWKGTTLNFWARPTENTLLQIFYLTSFITLKRFEVLVIFISFLIKFLKAVRKRLKNYHLWPTCTSDGSIPLHPPHTILGNSCSLVVLDTWRRVLCQKSDAEDCFNAWYPWLDLATAPSTFVWQLNMLQIDSPPALFLVLPPTS